MDSLRPGAYLDYAATSPLLPEVLEAMLPYLGERFANPSATYRAARAVRRAIDDARDAVAAFAGCLPDEVFFTSGGTEADNLAIRGSAEARPGGLVVTSVEHDAVLAPASVVGAALVGVDGSGQVDLDVLDRKLGASTNLVSVIAVQSETGICSPLDEVADRIARRCPGAIFHTDAVQAAPFFALGPLTARCDLISISAHKIGGPKGVGALIVRRGVRDRLFPIVRGGGQERNLRSGTENVAGIAGFGVAAGSAPPPVADIARMRDRLAETITGLCPDVEETGVDVARSPGICHLHVPGVAAEELLIVLDEADVAASAGSACASGALEPSHVLIAMGWTPERAKEAIRLSIGRSTTIDEVDFAASALVAGVRRLRAGEVPPTGKN